LTEIVPSMSRIRAKKLINRSWRFVQDSSLWSFQLGIGGFSTPAVTTAGTCTFTLGSDQVVGDASAAAAWAALPFYWRPSVQQIRAQGYSIYSVIAFDGVNTLTLDRPFVDTLPFFTGVPYQMFLAYIAAPVGLKRWLSVVDEFDTWALDIWTSRRTEDLEDPTRLVTSNPYRIMPLKKDTRGKGTPNQSATYGQMLFELWPTPQTQISYQTYYAAYWPDLVKNSDTLPDPIDEETVLEKALTFAYRDAEARKDIMAAKWKGGDFLALKRELEKDFLIRLKTLRLLDRDAVDAYFVNMKKAIGSIGPYFDSISMTSVPIGR
jgi:hypothetical protein